MNLQQLKDRHGEEAWEKLAAASGTKTKYVYQCAIGHRKPSAHLAKKMAAADRRLTLKELRPDIFGEPA